MHPGDLPTGLRKILKDADFDASDYYGG